MGEGTKITWANDTFNPWQGCVKVSKGCDKCYAESNSNRWGFGWGPDAPRRFTSEAYWKKPVRWNKEAEAARIRRRVFCASFSDVFEVLPGTKESWVAENIKMQAARDRLWRLIEETPWLDWLLLTKRPQNMLATAALVPDRWSAKGWPANVWAGTSCEDQATADKRIPILLDVPAKVRWLSCEPLIGPINFATIPCDTCLGNPKHRDVLDVAKRVNWIVVGGESGDSTRRPMDIEWARSIKNECEEAGVAFFLKQLGGPVFDKKHDLEDFPADLRIQDFPKVR